MGRGSREVPPAGSHGDRLARLRAAPGDSLCTVTCHKAAQVPPLLWRLHSRPHSPFPHVTPAAPPTPGSSSRHHVPAQTPRCPRGGSSPGRRAEGCCCKAGPQELAQLGDRAHRAGSQSPSPWGAAMTHTRPPPGPSTCPLLRERTEGPRGSSPHRGWRGPPAGLSLCRKGQGCSSPEWGRCPSERAPRSEASFRAGWLSRPCLPEVPTGQQRRAASRRVRGVCWGRPRTEEKATPHAQRDRGPRSPWRFLPLLPSWPSPIRGSRVTASSPGHSAPEPGATVPRSSVAGAGCERQGRGAPRPTRGCSPLCPVPASP